VFTARYGLIPYIQQIAFRLLNIKLKNWLGVSCIFHAACTHHETFESQDRITTNCPDFFRTFSTSLYLFVCSLRVSYSNSRYLPSQPAVLRCVLLCGKQWSAARRKMFGRFVEATPDSPTNTLHICTLTAASCFNTHSWGLNLLCNPFSIICSFIYLLLTYYDAISDRVEW
jgi:hypothetical protein